MLYFIKKQPHPPLQHQTFSFVRASLSQKLNLPSEPTVARVPWRGWNAISFTGKMSCVCPAWVTLDLWHLNVKLSFALWRRKVSSNITGSQAYVRVGWVDVLNCHTTFYGANRKSCWLVLFVSEYAYTSVLVLEWTLNPLQWGGAVSHILATPYDY